MGPPCGKRRAQWPIAIRTLNARALSPAMSIFFLSRSLSASVASISYGLAILILRAVIRWSYGKINYITIVHSQEE